MPVVIREPDGVDRCYRFQNIDMPVWAAVAGKMMSQPASQPAWAESAADIEIPSWLNLQFPQRPNLHLPGLIAFKDQDVGTWQGWNALSNIDFRSVINFTCQPGYCTLLL